MDLLVLGDHLVRRTPESGGAARLASADLAS
jgi:hypothetical protein